MTPNIHQLFRSFIDNHNVRLRSGKPYVPEKMTGTLTSSILKSVHTLTSPIFPYKLYSVATPGYPELLLLENHVRIIAFIPDLQRVSFSSVIGFLYHSSHHGAYIISNTYKGVIRALRPYYDAGNRYQPWWLLWCADSCMIATRICTSDQSETILVGAKQPRHIYVVIS
jgi:hypothetical protein